MSWFVPNPRDLTNQDEDFVDTIIPTLLRYIIQGFKQEKTPSIICVVKIKKVLNITIYT